MEQKFGRFDGGAFYEALDATRQARSLNWKQVADATGVSASTLTRMAQGRRPDVDGLAALAAWAGLRTDDFIRSEAGQSDSEPLAMISTYLRADKNLTPENAAFLNDVVRAAYKHLKSQEEG